MGYSKPRKALFEQPAKPVLVPIFRIVVNCIGQRPHEHVTIRHTTLVYIGRVLNRPIPNGRSIELKLANAVFPMVIAVAVLIPGVASADIFDWTYGGASDSVYAYGTLTATPDPSGTPSLVGYYLPHWNEN